MLQRLAARLCLRAIGLLIVVVLPGCGVPAPLADRAAVPAPSGPPSSALSPAPIPSSSSAPRPSTLDPRSPAPASLTPRGTIAYLDGGNLWLLDLVSGEARQLTDDGQSSDPAWSPDGQWLAFTTAWDGQPQLDELRADGSERRPLTTGPSQASFPVFGLDGTLVFVRRAPGDTPPIEIVRRDLGGGETVVHSEPGGLCGPIGLSIGGQTAIALALNCGRGSYTLLRTPGSSATIDLGQQIDGGVCAAPAVWARREPRIAAITARECAYDQETSIVVVEDVDSAPRVRTVLQSSGIRDLDWSPDGRWLVYARADGLWLIAADGQTQPRQVSATGAQPAWRPEPSNP